MSVFSLRHTWFVLSKLVAIVAHFVLIRFRKLVINHCQHQVVPLQYLVVSPLQLRGCWAEAHSTPIWLYLEWVSPFATVEKHSHAFPHLPSFWNLYSAVPDHLIPCSLYHYKSLYFYSPAPSFHFLLNCILASTGATNSIYFQVRCLFSRWTFLHRASPCLGFLQAVYP